MRITAVSMEETPRIGSGNSGLIARASNRDQQATGPAELALAIYTSTRFGRTSDVAFR